MTISYPSILYHNALERGTLSATSTATGYHANNVLARVPWQRWKAGGTGTINLDIDHGAGVTQALDTLAITGHNLHECGGSLSLSRSTDGIAWTGASFLTPQQCIDTDGRTMMIDTSSITSTATRYHRITFDTTTSAVWCGAICWGLRLAFTEYMHAGFDPQALDLKMHAPRTRSGDFLPAAVTSLGQTIALKFSRGGLAQSFFTTTGTPSWSEFISTTWSAGRPWWFAWDIERYPRTGWHCWPKKDDDTGVDLVLPSRRGWSFDMLTSVEGYLG